MSTRSGSASPGGAHEEKRFGLKIDRERSIPSATPDAEENGSGDGGGVSYYSEQGEAYLAQRSGAASDHVQRLRASMFSDLHGGTVLDFGCGTGGILSRLDAEKKVGVEIGEAAAEVARSSGIDVVKSVFDVPAESVDIAISFHALEHVDNDVQCMEGIFRALKPGGRARLVVPGELPIRKQTRWRTNPDKHLRTWTPLSFGNLAERAGFTDIRTTLQPPVSGSRGAKLFGKPYRYITALRRNSFDVILDARR